MAGFTIAIQHPRVQTKLVDLVTNILEDKLKTRVRIESVSIKFFKSIELNGIYIEDQRKDTLLFAKKLTAGISLFELRNRNVTIDDITLTDARIKLKRFKDVKGLNFDFIVDAFTDNDTTPSTSKPWNVKLKRVKLIENTFSYQDQRYNDYTPCVDFEDVHLAHLNIDADDFKVYDDSLFASINNISGFEKSGFRLNHFAAKTMIADKYMRFNNLNIQTPHSNLKLDYEMDFDSYDDFDDYINKVRMVADVDESKLSSDDLQYFASELFGLNKTIDLSGKAKGTVSLLKAKKLDIKYGSVSHFRGNVTMNGLPDFDKTYFDIIIDDLTTNREDIESVPEFPFTENRKISLPDNLGLLKTCRFKGKFTGFDNDFVAYGNANTGLGFVSSDINLKMGGSIEEYSGHISAKDFNIGALTGTSDYMGNITMSALVKGQGFKFENLISKVEGNVASITANNYTYKNITVNGEISKKLFMGSLAVDENNIKLKFDGSVDLRKPEPQFICTASIRDLHLTNLNLIKRDSSSNISASVRMNLSGNDIDNLTGSMEVSNFEYDESGQSFTINNIEFNSYLQDKLKHLDLISDYADININGIGRISTIVKSIQQIIATYFPVAASDMITVREEERGNFKIKIKDINPLLAVFYPDLTLAPNSIVEGDINTFTNQVTIHAQSPDMILHGIEFRELTISGQSEQKEFTAKLKAGEFLLNDSLTVNNFEFIAISSRDSASFGLSAQDNDTSVVYLRLAAQAYFYKDSSTLQLVPQSVVIIDKNQWYFNNNNRIQLYNGVAFNDFRIFKNDNESLLISGKTGESNEDELKVTFQNFDLSPLNNIFRNYDFEAGGIANGTIGYRVENKSPLLNADLNITRFSFYNDTLGDATIKSGFDPDKKRIIVDAKIAGGVARDVNIDGYYQIGKGKLPDELHFDGHFTRTSLSTFEHYFKGLASDMHGMISGDVSLRGSPEEPVLTGTASLQKANFTIDYLNTHYSLTDVITFNEKSISFNNITITDEHGNTAKLNGRILHNHLKDFGLDIHITPKKFMVLNTTESQNDLFYGKAYATGEVDIGGTFENVDMDISLTSNKGTKINLPLSSPEEVGESNYITFVKHDSVVQVVVPRKPELTGIEMNINLTVTKDAEINLIFDSKIGDIITGTGDGDLNMAVHNDGAFTLQGGYTIDQGSYYFTMKNLIGKYFIIEKGGTIRWNGDPYEGIIDIRAIYTKNAGLYDLLQDTSAQYKKKVPVEVILSLKNKLFNPDIKFDINVPNVDAATASLINRYLNTEEERNKQAMSLIVLNTFSAPSSVEGNSSGNTNAKATASLSEFVTHQLSNWASQISSSFNVDINYTPGDVVTSNQFDVGISTKILNDRVKLSGMVGYADNTSTNTNAANVVGDFYVEVDVSKDGRFKVKAFNKSNNNTLLTNTYDAAYTQGVGWFYRQEFDKFGDLFKRKQKTVTPADSTGTQ
ncbi:MAG: translocation/assembly module TamB domain-containing protein [Bacteroidia bacterium]